MRKKLLLALAITSVLVCVFAIGVSADGIVANTITSGTFGTVYQLSADPGLDNAHLYVSTLNTIEDKGNDTETIGIIGGINKRLWRLTREASFLDRALEYYGKGWNLYKDYYTGENYALCMLEMSNKEIDEEKIYYKVGAKKTFQEIIYSLLASLRIEEPEDLLWKYATLSNAYLACGDLENANKYETKFMEQQPAEWQIQTFNETKEIINK